MQILDLCGDFRPESARFCEEHCKSRAFKACVIRSECQVSVKDDAG